MLAIIIPYFKINFFEKTLESLAQQTDQRFQVYIGDDASPNAPTELLEKYQGKFNFTYKRFKDNLGSVSLVKQWERCIAMMKDEEWFMILGDDDVLGENVVETFYKNLPEIEKTAHVVRYSSVLINEKDEKISEEYHHPKLENAIESYCRKLKGESRSSLSEYIFRKESYNTFGFKDYALAWTTDDRAVIDFSQNKPIYSINALVKVRMSDQNITGKKDNLQPKISARLQSTREILEDYKKQLTKEQYLLLFGLFEHQFYRNDKNKILDEVFLLKETLTIRGLNLFLSQIKSIFLKEYFGGDIEFFYWKFRTRKLRKLKKIKILDSLNTLDYVLNNKKSLSRYGDGEFKIILNDGNPNFQKYDRLLAMRLKEVLVSNDERVLISVPLPFINLKGEKRSSKFFWLAFLNKYSENLNQFLNTNYTYGNAGVSRFYLGQTNKEYSKQVFRKFKSIWNDQNILIIEGRYTRLGLGNDLFDNASSVRRILCPEKDAFQKYDKILDKIISVYDNELVIIALGPTASVLAYDLSEKGIWALDVGHIDIEYEWMIAGAEERIGIKGKYISELKDKGDFSLVQNLEEKFFNEIIHEI